MNTSITILNNNINNNNNNNEKKREDKEEEDKIIRILRTIVRIIRIIIKVEYNALFKIIIISIVINLFCIIIY